MRKERKMKGKFKGTEEKLESEIKRETASSFAFQRENQDSWFYFYFALGSVFSHFEKNKTKQNKQLNSHLFLMLLNCGVGEDS